MKSCDEEVKSKHKEIIDSKEICHIKYKGIAAVIIENRLVDKNMNVLIREIDAK